jgi:hypothetical protein
VISQIITTVADTQRRVVRTELALKRLLDHQGLSMPTDADVDAALDEE